MQSQEEGQSDKGADALHDEALVLLAHDHMVRLEDFRRDRSGGVVAKVVQATVDARVFSDSRAEYERSLYGSEGFMADAMEAFDGILETVASNPQELLLVREAADIREAKRSGQLGLILGSEGGKLLEGSLATLRNFHRLGMRHLQFHWSIRNQLGTAQSTPNEPGLTEFGREVVSEMNRLGMIVDLSHSSPHSIQDALETTTKPVINSHSGSRELSDTSQNLWDDQIRAMAENGGVVAIHFATRIVLGDYPSSTIDDLIAQIEYVVEIGGIDTVGLGPDFFEYGDDSRGRNVMVNQGASPMPWTADLEDTGKLRNLTRALAGRGYRDADILKILGGNLMRVFETALG